MPISVDGLTVDDFRESGWRDIVAGVEERDCSTYWGAFMQNAERMQAAGDEKRGEFFLLLGHIASMFIDNRDHADPLKPTWRSPEGRTAAVSDFDTATDFLTNILPHIGDPELQARVADVVWLRKHDYKAARTAVSAYLDAARIGDHKRWIGATQRMERALDIATYTNQRELIEQAISQIEDSFESVSGNEPSLLPLRLMRILHRRKAGDPSKYAALAASLAAAAEGRGDWDQAREYWVVQADWFRVAQDGTQEKEARLRSAETYVGEAESCLSAGGGYLTASHLIECAVLALRKAGGARERVLELHHRLLGYQARTNAEMGVFTHQYDASEMIADATRQMAGKPLPGALRALALVSWPPQMEFLKEQAERQLQDSILSVLKSRYVNAVGRTVAVRSPPDEGETEQQADLRTEMYKVASASHDLHVRGRILPALLQVQQEHTVGDDDLVAIVRDNPFVPPGREEFYVRGLQAGFRQDWATAIHLLVPQIENSVRHVLGEMGVITSGLDDDGIQDERDLNRTLRLPAFTEPLVRLFGQNLVFDFRGLLIERYGSNLRNEVAHGLLSYDSFASAPCVYLWWMTLHILHLPIIAADVGLDGELHESTVPGDGLHSADGATSVPESTAEA